MVKGKNEVFMKKWLTLLLACCLPLSAAAEGVVTANGGVESETVHQIVAPFSGVVLPFDWQTGDYAEKQDVLFEMDLLRVYAPADGTLTAQFAQPGDLCSDVISQYGMLASIEKEHDRLVAATITGAYDNEENRIIHVGEKVWMVQSNDRENEGSGRVIAVEGNSYTVELLGGLYDLGDSVKLYRDENMGTKTAIGTGDIVRMQALPVMGEGRVVHCHVQEGDRVRKGQLLYELARADADPDVMSAQIAAPARGTLEITALSGQQVYRGQVLARLHELDEMNVVAAVDEMDLDLVKIGDNLKVVLDRYPGQEISGMVTEIAGVGIPRQNATYYNVTIRLATGLELLPGMNATVQLGR